MSNDYTLLEMRDSILSRIRETNSRIRNSTILNEDINLVQATVLNKNHYRFMDGSVAFNTIIDTTLSADITSASVTVPLVDATLLPTSGTVFVNGNRITYTNVSGNTLTGATGITANHASGDRVYKLYSFTELGITNFGVAIYLELDGTEVQYFDGRAGVDPDKYSIDDQDFIHLPYQNSAKQGIFKYKKEVSFIRDNDDTFLIPDQYVGLIRENVLYQAKKDLGYSEVDYLAHESKYRELLGLMEKRYAEQTENKFQRVRSPYQNGFVPR
jgi:hypothetical protein